MNDLEITRRSMLGRLLVLLGAGGVAGAVDTAATAAAEPRSSLTFEARRIVVKGESLATLALFVDGRRAGVLYSEDRAPLRVLGPKEHGLERLEEHTINLAGGAIFARAVVSAGRTEGAVLGGTGAYAGARGTLRIASQHGTTRVRLDLT